VVQELRRWSPAAAPTWREVDSPGTNSQNLGTGISIGGYAERGIGLSAYRCRF
jgi:hypothetical protein